MKPSYCSPDNDEIFKHYNTCYCKDDLRIIITNYNKSILNDKSGKDKCISLNQSKRHMLNDLRSRFKGIHESEWLDMPFMENELTNTRVHLKSTFRPSLPPKWKLNKTEWLSTMDIMNVMSQYELKYKNFKFMGVYPIDFAHKYNSICISEKMCKFKVSAFLKQGYSQFAVVFNLDKHYEPGSHWVSLYCGLKPYMTNFGCYYIDSNSIQAPDEVKVFMQTIHEQVHDHYKDLKKTFEVIENTKRFQYKNSECGMFSMFFIIKFLERMPYKKIINLDVHDDQVQKFRYVYYNTMISD